MTPREEVLARVRVARGHSPVAQAEGEPEEAAAIPRGYRTAGQAGQADLLALLTERLTDYRAAVTRTTPAALANALEQALAAHGARRIVVPPGLDVPGWLPHPAGTPPGVEIIADDGLSARELDTVDAVVTGAAVAIAETGTIILDGSPGQGRRALTLVPDCHVCLLRAGQIVHLVPEALARLDPSRPLTWISGPSATSDIEFDRVEGVHGPRTLHVILVQGPDRT